VRTIDHIGEREIRASAAIAERFDEREIPAVGAALANQSSLARHVREVRELARSFVQLGSTTKASDRRRVANLISRQEDHVRAVAQTLEDDRGALMADNALIQQQRRALGLQIRSLGQFAELSRVLDAMVVEHIASLSSTDARAARAFETDVLFVIRQRRRELLTHVTIATQGELSLRRIEQGNVEVIRALRSATTTTLTALRSAALTMQAFEDQDGESAAPDNAADLEAWQELLVKLDDLERKRRTSLSDIVTSGPRAAS
jgi:hypothetical protein